MKGIFVTGTGTGVGKTVVCGLLGGFLQAQGMRVATQKWVETGCAGESQDLRRHIALGGLAADAASEPEIRVRLLKAQDASPADVLEADG